MNITRTSPIVPVPRRSSSFNSIWENGAPFNKRLWARLPAACRVSRGFAHARWYICPAQGCRWRTEARRRDYCTRRTSCLYERGLRRDRLMERQRAERARTLEGAGGVRLDLTMILSGAQH
jgi:hypothetical protein